MSQSEDVVVEMSGGSSAPLPANSAFYLSSLLPSSTTRLRSFPLPVLFGLSCALLFLAFVFLPSVSTWILSLTLGLLRFLLFVVLFLVSALWWCQSSLLYMPSFMGRHSVQRSPSYNSVGFQSPEEHSMAFTSHLIPCPDGVQLHAWLLLRPSSLHCPTLIFFHGNAGNIGFRLPNAKSLYFGCGLNVLMVEYRGFGDSSGTPSEPGLALDGDTALTWLRTQQRAVDPDNVFLFGRSLGGAIAIHVASHSSSLLRGVVLENTFTSVDDMVVTLGQRMVRMSGWTVRALRLLLSVFMTSHWDSEGKVGDIRCPVLLISGEKDELVPAWQMRRLYEKVGPERAELLLIREGTHNDTYIRGGTEYWIGLRDFIHKHAKKSASASGNGGSSGAGGGDANGNGHHPPPLGTAAL